jgi:hypothetical protein
MGSPRSILKPTASRTAAALRRGQIEASPPPALPGVKLDHDNEQAGKPRYSGTMVSFTAATS